MGKGGGRELPHDAEDQSIFTAITTYLGIAVIFFFGRLRDKFGTITGRSRFRDELLPKHANEAPLLDPYGAAFYARRIKFRVQDCFFRPVRGRPGTYIDVMKQTIDEDGIRLKTTGEVQACLNLGSYNYLGFADDWDATCGECVHGALRKYGPASCSAQSDAGTMNVHRKLEQVVADFVGKPAAVIFSMGYNTNQLVLPAIANAGSLIISDKLNHVSIVNGCRASGAKVIAFKHNNVDDLERTVRKAIIEGRGEADEPYQPWNKIIIAVEGIYSMEGEICDLRAIVDVAKKYKCYTYVDEAHSIGALGKTGRGVCEHTGVSPDEVDILMGTFSKSFNGMGGYIAGSRELIDHLRSRCAGMLYSSSLSPVVAEQVLTAFRIISGEDGTDIGRERLQAIKDNANYFRAGLKEIGCSVLGDDDSPVVPVMLFHYAKISAFSREALARRLAVVVVGAPAVPLYGSRVRFCLSAAHTREDLSIALAEIAEIARDLGIRYTRSAFG
ncbi:5-aminolevulinate synthase, mitochondrial [Hondaea fermentalgiana]|uniref:5-aminolevulinate synthase, mitochondrial n=1 Tax=Hondaea fermentalgiana TaxID=2315210 RepID=A0A2R5GX05_9STRA|nr:5-aminolevulinate synthase, mitochondrial [Hondaea fermentalgiana]|eukprot:GBG32941.1 5-aminolevulinate synthase, mitochondrial [Hondaea fermentalgiana]